MTEALEEVVFTTEDYMNGKPLPSSPESEAEPEAPRNGVRQYFYGVVRASNGHARPGDLSAFIRRDTTLEGVQRWRQECATRGACIIAERFVEAFPESIQKIADELLAQLRSQCAPLSHSPSKTKAIPPAHTIEAVYPGSVVAYCDGAGFHTAVVLRLGKVQSLLLFATSNPLWNPQCRPITSEECALMGYPMKKNKQTYFAPVIRDNCYIRATGISFPIHRVQELLKEFETNQ